MKKLIIIILAIMLNLAIIGNTFAYDLSEPDKKSADNIALKLESFISKKGESYRSIIVEKLKKIDSGKSDKLKAYIDYIVLALNKESIDSLDSKEAIFQKIEENIKKKELENQSGIQPEIKNVLVQGDFKAEYISNNGDYTKSDKIKITQNGKSWEIPGVYDPKNRSEQQEKCFKENKIGSDGFRDTGNCWIEHFNGFKDYSKYGYLSYDVGMYEGLYLKVIDVKDGTTLIKSNGFISFSGFVKNGKQFVYGFLGEIGPNSGLYITSKGDFEKSQNLLGDNIFIIGGYIDEKNIYVKTSSIEIDTKTQTGTDKFFYKIIDIESGKVIYSQEITLK